MFKPTSICYSALTKRTKRVKVQILRDFPQFNLFKGQVTQVKPSMMRNYLHDFNGAKYILQDSDINTFLFENFTKEEQIREKEQLANQQAMAATAAAVATAKAETLKKPKLSKEVEKQEKKKDITIKDVYIPGLNL